ncbi:MAG: hypothetical protein QXM06_02500 [Archaeoglobaceae archaeon]
MLIGMSSIHHDFGRFIRSRVKGKKVVEVVGVRSKGLFKSVVDHLGYDVLFILTMRGYETILRDKLSNSALYILSEKYFDIRLHITNVRDLQRLVKQIVNEITTEMKKFNFDAVIIYRANDLPPTILGMDQNIVEEEFWRILTMDFRSLDATFMLVYEKVEYRPDILSQFADAVVIMDHSPQVWSVFE